MTVANLTVPLTQWPDGRYRSGDAPAGLFSLSAPYVDGEQIVVTTSELNFGSRASQSPLIWDRFNGTPEQLLTSYDPAWQGYNGTVGALIGDGVNARYSGGKFAYNTSARGEFFTNYKTFGASRTRFLSYWWRSVNLEISGSDQGVIKLCRLTASSAIGGGGVYSGKGAHYLSALIPQNDGDPFLGYYDSAGVDTTNLAAGGGNEYIVLPINEWVRINMWVRMSEVNQATGHFGVSVLGGEFWERTDLIQNVSGQPELLLDSVILGLMQANAAGTYSQQITDIYMTDLKGRFEVGDAENYDECTLLEVQPYDQWANKRVRLTGNTTAIGPGVDKWLFYTDENHQTNGGTGVGFFLGAQ